MKTHISFIYNGKDVAIDFRKTPFKPSTTVLNWIRLYEGQKDVKEGCAEGDCGACTVVVAETSGDGKSLRYKAVNSCLLFLPALDGKMLITAAGISPLNHDAEKLHPVQKAIVDSHATQCGFCTPGFVMSLFALYHKIGKHSVDEINNALAGNLCRCTGYDSIRKATLEAMKGKRADHYSSNEKILAAQLKKIQPEDNLLAENHGQLYIRPVSLKELFALRKKYPFSIIVNGSTDVALKQSKHFETLPAVLDISGITDIKYLKTNKTGLEFGSGVCLEDLRLAAEKTFPQMHSLLSVFASRQIRNMATVGGNLGSSSPIGDTLPLLIACDAEIIALSPKGKRTIPSADFITGYRKNALKKDEIIFGVNLPVPAKNELVEFYKVSKRHDMDISTVSGAFRLILKKDGTVDLINLVFGGMADRTKKAEKTMAFLTGKKWNEENVKKAMKILEKEFTPLSDARSGAEFRNSAAANLLMKFHVRTCLCMSSALCMSDLNNPKK
ncbi:MAG: xanthine dehydrogenase small subunit [Bacteroidetes bacterium GWF2_38_335]|nr:MAG: xanthine dehydrogenase small subunit [Bacteroidetes bacterium GWF2_38_335]OFY79320.1 MAG: xanthine dehydrogenase small subunit [Bacteroidetes bacterium RIFOXYA12_FULL_38_20]HBS85577.1 xanthine dehydrogenase small subunit [Bacteroidales bacterium]